MPRGGITNTPLGTTDSGTIVATGATLDLNGFTLGTAEALTLNGTGVSNGGALTNSSATSATYSGVISLGSASSIGNVGALTLTGVISGANHLTKVNSGILTLQGANTFSGGLFINYGTVQLGTASVLSDNLPVTLTGGTLKTGATSGFSETVNTLCLTDNSVIALGTGVHELHFAESKNISWTSGKTLTITGWTGALNGTAVTSGTAGKIFVSNTSNGLTTDQLTQIKFRIDSYDYAATILSTGEIVPFGTIEVHATSGSVIAYYPTLEAAFDKINYGTHQGNITIKVNGNTTETTTADLKASGTGNANYTSVVIYPTGPYSISGNFDNSLINLEGADNVTIDGRINQTGSIQSLTLINEGITTQARVLRFGSSASNNTIRYCNIQGSCPSSSAGVIFFSNTSSGDGNDNNTIEYCNITNAGGNRQRNTIYSKGNSGHENSNNTIRYNNIYDFLNPSDNSNGIYLLNNSDNWTISNNSFYESTLVAPNSGDTCSAIRLNSNAVNNTTISANYIGGNAPLCTGTFTVNAEKAHKFYGIYINGGIGTTHSILNNTIKNMSYYSTAKNSWSGIWINSGNANITGNIIGSETGTNAISLTTEYYDATSYGINLVTSGDVNISGNIIGSITNSHSSPADSHSFYGIYKSNISGITTIRNNTIGSNTTANSIQTNSTSTNYNQTLCGIFTAGTENTTISGNTIANLTNSSTKTGASLTQGICTTNGTNTVQQNFIHSFGAVTASNLLGISSLGGTGTLSNNIILLGNDVNSGCNISGILKNNASSLNIYHNTVYLNGTATSGSSSTYALNDQSVSSAGHTENNIFWNARSGGGENYAAFLQTTPTGLTLNYNNYGYSGSYLGQINGINYATLSDFQSATGQDASSLNKDPQFVSAGSTIATDYKARVSLPGATGTGIATDYGLAARLIPPTMGAWEQLITKWKGSISTAWNNSDNWTANILPESDANLVFDAAPANHCLLDQDRSVTDITNAQSTYRLITNGHRLTVKGNLNFSGGAQIDASANGSTVEFAGSAAQTIPSGAFYYNAIYNLTVNNANDVILNGTLRLLNTISATSGRLDAFTNSPTVSYAGMSAQTIESGYYQNEKVHNLSIDNAAGVTLNTNFTVNNSLTINAGDTLIIAPVKELNILGAIINNAGTSGLVINSTVDGTGSLIHHTDNVPATVKRYISGIAEDWHFLSSPVSNQDINVNQGNSDSWLPSGTYGNGTGYDLYAWNEPTSCWIYKLNTTSTVNWNTVHPGSAFIPGRGYIYSLQNVTPNPTKTFAGYLNNGSYSIALKDSSTTAYAGFNLIGNPYPSAIDWEAASGWTRTNLADSIGGFNVWIWNPVSNNYGVYNSGSHVGTNGVTNFIPPMQSFFVKASSNGNLVMTNEVRVHDNTTRWKSATADDSNMLAKLSLTVISEAGLGADEVLLLFGTSQNTPVASKLFSSVATAPSLYLTDSGNDYSIRDLTTTVDNARIPIQFKAGSNGVYTLTGSFDTGLFETVLLEDCQTDQLINLKENGNYLFHAKTGDATNRFVLHFAPFQATQNYLPAQVNITGNKLTVNLEKINEETNILVSDLLGRVLCNKKSKGGIKEIVELPTKGQIFIVSLYNHTGNFCQKVVNGK